MWKLAWFREKYKKSEQTAKNLTFTAKYSWIVLWLLCCTFQSFFIFAEADWWALTGEQGGAYSCGSILLHLFSGNTSTLEHHTDGQNAPAVVVVTESLTYSLTQPLTTAVKLEDRYIVHCVHRHWGKKFFSPNQTLLWSKEHNLLDKNNCMYTKFTNLILLMNNAK